MRIFHLAICLLFYILLLDCSHNKLNQCFVANNSNADTFIVAKEMNGYVIVRMDTVCVWGNCMEYGGFRYYYLEAATNKLYYLYNLSSIDSCALRHVGTIPESRYISVSKLLSSGCLNKKELQNLMQTGTGYPCEPLSSFFSKLVIKNRYLITPYFVLDTVSDYPASIYLISKVRGKGWLLRGSACTLNNLDPHYCDSVLRCNNLPVPIVRDSIWSMYGDLKISSCNSVENLVELKYRSSDTIYLPVIE